MDRVPVHDTRTDRIFPVLLATVGLAQARPNYIYIVHVPQTDPEILRQFCREQFCRGFLSLHGGCEIEWLCHHKLLAPPEHHG